MTESVELLTPVGRLVAGDPWVPKTKNAEGAPLIIKEGPNAGQPRVDYYFGVAISKSDPGWAPLWAKIHGAARAAFPNRFDATGNPIGAFSFKVADGDSQIPNTRKIKPCDREGWPGHYILHFSSSYPPKIYSKGGAQILTDPELLKRGYYVRVSGTVVGNKSVQQPGVYLNHSMVELCGYGTEIHTGPDGEAVFGATQASYQPPGMSPTPLAPSTAPGGGAPVAPPVTAVPPLGAPMAPVAGVPVTPGAPATTPVYPVAPATDFLTGPGAAAPVEFRIDANGNRFSRDQLTAAGYTPEQISVLPVG